MGQRARGTGSRARATRQQERARGGGEARLVVDGGARRRGNRRGRREPNAAACALFSEALVAHSSGGMKQCAQSQARARRLSKPARLSLFWGTLAVLVASSFVGWFVGWLL